MDQSIINDTHRCRRYRQQLLQFLPLLYEFSVLYRLRSCRIDFLMFTLYNGVCSL